MSPPRAICGGVNGGVSNSDPLLSVVVSEGEVGGKHAGMDSPTAGNMLTARAGRSRQGKFFVPY